MNQIRNILCDKIIAQIETWNGTNITKLKSISGGCIANSYQVHFSNGNKAFLKTNGGQDFTKEANGLKEIKKSRAIAVPDIYLAQSNIILIEWIPSTSATNNFFTTFGTQFANLHRFTSDNFGFYQDNYIGKTIQKNSYHQKWQDFYYQ